MVLGSPRRTASAVSVFLALSFAGCSNGKEDGDPAKDNTAPATTPTAEEPAAPPTRSPAATASCRSLLAGDSGASRVCKKQDG